MSDSIGTIVKQRREAKGWSQRDLVRYMGGKITQPKIVKMETGEQENVTLETLELLAGAFGCAAVDLLPERFKRPQSRAA
jgi:transcriptional regulator with XRE-family HTH domain